MNDSTSYQDVHPDQGSPKHFHTSPQLEPEISNDNSDANFSPGPDLSLAISDSSGVKSTGTQNPENNLEPSISFPFSKNCSGDEDEIARICNDDCKLDFLNRYHRGRIYWGKFYAGLELSFHIPATLSDRSRRF